MKKVVKKLFVTACMITIISLNFSSVSYGMASWVQKSNCWVVYNQKENKDRAKGYITAKRYHYANVWLYDASQYAVAKSGRKWGYKKVVAQTKWVKCKFLGSIYDSARIFYGC